MQDYCDVVDSTELKFDNNVKFLNYNTANFNSIVYSRYSIARHLLDSDKTIIYVDVDIVVKCDFERDIKRILNNDQEQMLVQTAHNDLPCTGFFALGTKFSRKVLDCIISNKTTKQHDQRFFVGYINSGNKINYKLLDKDLYPNGKWYYDNHTDIDHMCRLIHFNCVIGEDDKILKIKKYGYWF